MDNCYAADHTAGDHIHTDIICNTEEPHHLNHPRPACSRPLGALKPLFCTLYFSFLYISDIFAEMVASVSFAGSIRLRNYK